MQRNKSRVRFHCSDPSVLTVGIIRNERFTVCAEIPHSRVDAPALSTYTELFRNLALGTNMLSSEETQSRPKSPDDSLLARIESHAKNMAREDNLNTHKDTLHSQTRELVEYGGDRDRCAGSTVPGPTDCQSRHPARRGQCLAESTQPGCDTSGLALHYRGCAHQAKVTLPINTKT